MARANYVFNPQLGTPRFIADFREPENLVAFPAKIDASQFRDKDTVAVVLSANANQNATALTIAASLVFTGGYTKIPKGTNLYFGGAKVATLTADYTAGTSIAVAALPTALVSGDTAYFSPAATYNGPRVQIPAGTIIGRTYAERDASTPFGPGSATDDEFFVLAYDVSDANINNDCHPLQTLVSIYENYLPQWSTISVPAAEVLANSVTGAVSAGKYVVYSTKLDKSVEFAYNANTATIQTALEGLWGAGNVTYTGTDFTSGTITVAAAAVPAGGVGDLLIDIDGATGATAASISETTKGGLALLEKLRKTYRCVKGVN